MTFSKGASEPGFTFNGWSSDSSTIWVANLASTATVTKNVSTWNFISFYVGPFVGANTMKMESDLGDIYIYDTDSTGKHFLNWVGITSVTCSRISGSGASADHDDFVYSVDSIICNNPTVPVLTYAPTTICDGNSITLNISGNLNDATTWNIYGGSCGGILIGSTASSSLVVSPSFPSLTYHVRGEGGCVVPGACGSITVIVTANDDASFDYSAASYCINDPDPTPTINGTSGGIFTSSPGGLSLDAFTGLIDVSASTPQTYSIKYTTSGVCPDSTQKPLTINAADTSVTYNPPTLTANAAGASYQWIDCNTMLPIPGEINQWYTPASNGSYAVVVTENGCTDTSSCYDVIVVSIKSNSLNNLINLYPNPTSGEICIELERTFESISVKITNTLGQTIASFRRESANKLDFIIDGEAGVYYIKLTTSDNWQTTLMVIKE